MNQQTEDSEAKEIRFTPHLTKDHKRRHTSQSPARRRQRKSEDPHTKVKASLSSKQETPTASSCTKASLEGPILKNGLPDGFSSQLDETQWNEFISKLIAHFNHHRLKYDKYHKDPEIHAEHDKKKLAFMNILKTNKPAVPQERIVLLWKQFWIVELKKMDEDKWSQQRNQLIKHTLKRAQENSNSKRGHIAAQIKLEPITDIGGTKIKK